MRVSIDSVKCQGHGRCYTLAPEVFDEDGEGQGLVLGSGDVAPDQEAAVHLAEANCPEGAVVIEK
ncbi:MAG TPA: ferredoxin [Mycobacteriales bacterium]|nr:ferredoxin [Mycobacteriales bacterium]HWA67679.1 ferredoxin [Mycobacteriales bacterium]